MMDWFPLDHRMQQILQDGHYMPILKSWSHLKGVSFAGWDALLFPAGFGIIRDAEGEIRWTPIIATLIGAAILAGAAAIISTQSRTDRIEAALDVWMRSRQNQPEEIAQIKAIQATVLQRLDKIETSSHPATSKRFNSDDAREMEERLTRRIERLEQRGMR